MADNWWERSWGGSRQEQQELFAFKAWLSKQQGWWAAYGPQTVSAGNLTMGTFKTHPLYQIWVRAGRPDQRIDLPQTEEERAGVLRGAVTAQGFIPYKGNERQKEYLKSIGYELVESDEFGVLPDEEKYYKKKEEEEAEEPSLLTREELRRLALLPLETQQRAQGYSEGEVRSLLRGQAMAGGYYDTESQRRQMMSNAYEQVKQEILGTLNEPVDWIKRWQLQNAPNPYNPEKSLQEEVNSLQEQYEVAVQRADEIRKRLRSGDDSLIIEDIANPQTPDAELAVAMLRAPQEIRERSEAAQRELAALRASKMEDYYRQGIPTGNLEQQMAGIALWAEPHLKGVLAQREAELAAERAAMTRQEEIIVPETGERRMITLWDETMRQQERPTTPPAPAWLSQFAPGQVTGRPITKEKIPTPSGQLLTRTPWSQLQGVAGFAEWSGGRPWRDILGHAELMQPRTPIEAGRTRWRPARQFA